MVSIQRTQTAKSVAGEAQIHSNKIGNGAAQHTVYTGAGGGLVLGSAGGSSPQLIPVKTMAPERRPYDF